MNKTERQLTAHCSPATQHSNEENNNTSDDDDDDIDIDIDD